MKKKHEGKNVRRTFYFDEKNARKIIEERGENVCIFTCITARQLTQMRRCSEPR
jgi:hypothetical protein